MAKKTKDSNLSLEERLEQALIPNWDEPYKLPDNWCWTKFLYCSKIRTGKKDANYGSENGEYPFFTCASDPIRCNGYSFDCRAILLAGNGDIGNISIYDGKFEAYQRTYVVETLGNINTKYAYYYFKYRWVDFNQDKMFGSAIPYIRLGNLQDFPFPIAPIEEQERIVKCVDVLFAKLDEAKEKAQEVVDGFETRKAAILHKTFSGELTAKWREENHIDQNWSLTSLEKIAERVFDGPFGSNLKSEDYVSSGIRVVRLENLKNLWFDDSKQSFVSREKYDTIAKHTVYPSDLIMSTFISDETKVCQMPKHIPYAINKADCIAIRLKSDVNKRFVLYYLSSKFVFDMLQNQIHGATRPRVNSKQIKSIAIKMPSVSEQNEIVRILDRMYDSEIKAIETAEAVIEQIDKMKKAILARAFRGELGTNDPSEESAKALIKQLLEERIKAEELEPKRTPKKRKEVLIVVKTIMETLKPAEKLTPEKLKAETGLEIDDFYDQLKVLIDSGQIREIRIDGESYLEAAK